MVSKNEVTQNKKKVAIELYCWFFFCNVVIFQNDVRKQAG